MKINPGMLIAAGDALAGSLSRMARFWPLSWRSVGAIVLAMLLARWTWIVFAPHPVYTSATAERSAEQEAELLFGKAVASNATAQGIALPNVQLLGVFAASAYKPGFAILKLDGNRQLGVAEGEEVAPGTKLVAVKNDHVLLEHAGIQQRVNLENQYVVPAGGTAGTAPAYGAAAAKLQNNLPSGRNFRERMAPTHR